MATGVIGAERLNPDALIAALPHRDPHPLPDAGPIATLHYPNRLSVSEILEPLKTTFTAVDRTGRLIRDSTIKPNALVLTDNLFGLHGLIAQDIRPTLIYLDPPYNTGMDFQSRDLEHAYNDQQGDSTYIEYMRRRLVLMRELMTSDGSIYVHIGHQMVSHLKVVMDDVFGPQNFRNLITRRKCSSKNFTKHQYANLNDFVLFYSKSNNYKWNQPGQTPSSDWLDKEYPKRDSAGRYKLVPIHAPGTRNGETGRMWRGVLPPPGKHWQYTPDKLDIIDRAGEMHWSKNGNPRRKVYLTQDKLVPFTDYWDGFRDAHHQSIAVTGYPTEKNLEMMRMIVAASSDPGDTVLDPFCGSGTTLHAAEDLERRWVGMDQSFAAMKASIQRFRYGLKPMGDFVNRSTKNEAGRAASLDLFGDEAGEADQAIVGLHQPVPFNLFVDEELLALHAPDIEGLASL
jgi:adenine-specific DNA-methyltransferase